MSRIYQEAYRTIKNDNTEKYQRGNRGRVGLDPVRMVREQLLSVFSKQILQGSRLGQRRYIQNKATAMKKNAALSWEVRMLYMLQSEGLWRSGPTHYIQLLVTKLALHSVKILHFLKICESCLTYGEEQNFPYFKVSVKIISIFYLQAY